MRLVRLYCRKKERKAAETRFMSAGFHRMRASAAFRVRMYRTDTPLRLFQGIVRVVVEVRVHVVLDSRGILATPAVEYERLVVVYDGADKGSRIIGAFLACGRYHIVHEHKTQRNCLSGGVRDT